MMRLSILTLLFLLGALPACKKAPRNHKAEVVDMVHEMERLVEKRDLRDLKKLISSTYTGGRGQTKAEVVRFLQFHFLKRRTISLLLHIRSLDLTPTLDEAQLKLVVGAGSTPVSNFKALSGLNADLFDVDLSVVDEDGRWVLKSASWKRVRFQQIDNLLDTFVVP